jgi:response regulator of citrate/malate metabolism
MTVQSDERLRQEALKAGIQGYLVKPFDLKQLEEAISISDSGLRNVE